VANRTVQDQRQTGRDTTPVEPEALLRFVRQFSVKLKAGLSVEKSLAALGSETRHRRLRQVCSTMHVSVAAGGSLALAMRARGSTFDPFVIGLVDWGEKARKLRPALASIADYLEHRGSLERGLRGAVAQPLDALLFLLLATFVATVALAFQVRDVLPAADAALPATMSVMDRVASRVAEVVRAAWPWVGVLGFVAFVTVRVVPGHPAARAWLDGVALKLPLVGGAVRTSGIASFLRAVGIWMQAGGTMAQAMTGAAVTATNVSMRNLILATRERIEKGKPYIDALVEQGFLRLGDVTTVQAADRRGQIGAVMLTLAGDREQEAMGDIKRLRAVTHTLVVSILGIAIVGVMLTLYVPVFFSH
jgi:type IV pilus assembly protein PilC